LKLEGQVAVITGASGGIGSAIAETFATEGARLGLIAHRNIGSLERLLNVVRSYGTDAIGLKADIISESDIKEASSRIVQNFGRVDILVNCSGIIGSVKRIEFFTVEEWEEVFGIDVRGTFLWIKHCLPTMLERKRGNIINLSSVAGFKASLISPCYSAAKGAILSLTKSLALAYARDGIRVNCISPGTIDTPMAEGFFREAKDDAEQKALKRRFVDRHPLGRFGTPYEVAKGALYLASADSSFVTGINLVIDGGLSL